MHKGILKDLREGIRGNRGESSTTTGMYDPDIATANPAVVHVIRTTPADHQNASDSGIAKVSLFGAVHFYHVGSSSISIIMHTINVLENHHVILCRYLCRRSLGLSATSHIVSLTSASQAHNRAAT